MKNRTRHTGTITNLKRLPSSLNGNPRFEFDIDGYTVRTAVDSMDGYSIQNFEDKPATVVIGTHYTVLTLDELRAA